MAARLEAPRTGVRPVTVTAPAPRAGLAWPQLPAVAELATISAGYLGYALVRPAIHANRHAAERLSHLRADQILWTHQSRHSAEFPCCSFTLASAL